MTGEVFTASAWPEADGLFHSNPDWRGSDDAYSVVLGPNRTLWLFGDTYIAAGTAVRRGSTMINNSIAIQDGIDPLTAMMRFYWNSAGDVPASFFPPDGDIRLWPLDGIRLGDHLLLFFQMVRFLGDSGPWGWERVGWKALMVDNPDDDPAAWEVREVTSHLLNDRGFEGPGSLVEHEGHVYAHGMISDRQLELIRWRTEDAAAGDLSRTEAWGGAGAGWVVEADSAGVPEPVIPGAHTEFTVRWDATIGKFIQFQGIGVEGAVLGARTSERLEGPWSPIEPIFVPDEVERRGVFLYAFKAHPELDAGGDIVVTYVTNSLDDTARWDESLYWPRFVRVRARLASSGPGSAG